MMLPQTFFRRPVQDVARDLLGKTLVRRCGKKQIRALIMETEAYDGEHDLACHARFGKTQRNAVMFGRAGCWYVYLCYGMHWMLNIVTGEEGYPAAVLIRGAVLLDPSSRKLCVNPLHVKQLNQSNGLTDKGLTFNVSGPGRLTKTLKINGSLNGQPAKRPSGLWIEEGIAVPNRAVLKMPRIGVGYAGKWAKKKWRFVLPTLPFVSK